MKKWLLSIWVLKKQKLDAKMLEVFLEKFKVLVKFLGLILRRNLLKVRRSRRKKRNKLKLLSINLIFDVYWRKRVKKVIKIRRKRRKNRRKSDSPVYYLLFTVYSYQLCYYHLKEVSFISLCSIISSILFALSSHFLYNYLFFSIFPISVKIKVFRCSSQLSSCIYALNKAFSVTLLIKSSLTSL